MSGQGKGQGQGHEQPQPQQSGPLAISLDITSTAKDLLGSLLASQTINAKLDELLARTQQIMASQQDFQAKIDQINSNTSASAAAAAAIAQNLTDLRTKLDQMLTDAGIPPDQEQAILAQLSTAADTSTDLKTFLEKTASGSGQEPAPVPAPASARQR